MRTAWTPPDSVMNLGSVLLPKVRLQPLPPPEYRLLLADRIDRLIKKETPERARELLRQYEPMENLTLEPETAAEVLAENSEWLRERAAFPKEAANPPFKNSPETAAMLESETLEEFLATLYHDSE